MDMAKKTGGRKTMLKLMTAQKKTAFTMGWYVENVSFKLWLLRFIFILTNFPPSALFFSAPGTESNLDLQKQRSPSFSVQTRCFFAYEATEILILDRIPLTFCSCRQR
jgi:hypothetical protein